jgi:hypothetical protein
MSQYTNPVHLFVAESYDAISGDLNSATITSGEITIIDADTRQLATTSSKRIQFAVYSPSLAADGFNKPIRLGPVIARDNSDGQGNVVYYRYCAYQAPVSQVRTAEMTSGGSGITAGLTYILKTIVEGSAENVPFMHKLMPRIYTVSIPVGTTNPQNYLAAQFNTLINNDANRFVNSTVSGDVLTLTARSQEDIFNVVFAGENWVDPVNTQTVAWVRGAGTAAMVKEEEYLHSGGVNKTEYREHNVFNQNQSSLQTAVVASSTYDCFTIEHLSENESFGHRRSRRPITQKVYFKSDAASKAAFKTLLESLVP